MGEGGKRERGDERQERTREPMAGLSRAGLVSRSLAFRSLTLRTYPMPRNCFGTALSIYKCFLLFHELFIYRVNFVPPFGFCS